MSCGCTRPSAFHRETRRARVEHTCCECRHTIKRGSAYEYVSGIWDGAPGSYKTCLDCVDLRALYDSTRHPSECAPFRHLFEYIGNDCSYGVRHPLTGEMRSDWRWLAALATDEKTAAIVGRAIGLLYEVELRSDDVRQAQLRAFREGRRITLLQARAEVEVEVVPW